MMTDYADDAGRPSGEATAAPVTLNVRNLDDDTAGAQPMLFELPDPPAAVEPRVANSQRRTRLAVDDDVAGKSASTAIESDRHSGDGTAQPDMTAIVLVDPFAIEPEPFNGRGLGAFDPDRNRELIDDMRARGNTVPVRLRPRGDGAGWACSSGSRRVNAARVIAADDPAFRVAAIIDAAMSDADAYALCLADNRGRSDVTPLQRGREIRWAIEHLHGGSRQAYIEHHGVDPSVVSRALDVVTLPEQILAGVEDREALPTLFAEKIAPKLRDKAERKIILGRARALGTDRLPAPRLLHYLLTGERSKPQPDRRMIGFGRGRERLRASVTVTPDHAATFKLPPRSRLNAEQRGELINFLKAQIDDLLNEGPPQE